MGESGINDFINDEAWSNDILHEDQRVLRRLWYLSPIIDVDKVMFNPDMILICIHGDLTFQAIEFESLLPNPPMENCSLNSDQFQATECLAIEK